MSGIWPYVAALLPTILVAIFFYFIIKSMLEGDRRERLAQRRFEAEQDARLASGGSESPTSGADAGKGGAAADTRGVPAADSASGAGASAREDAGADSGGDAAGRIGEDAEAQPEDPDDPSWEIHRH